MPSLRRRWLGLALVALVVASAAPAQSRPIPTPEAFFGFKMGADKKLARWDKLVEYYHLLGRSSDRLQVVDMGPTTLGNRFLALIVSSPANLARLEELRWLNAILSDPRGASRADIDRAIGTGRAVIIQSMCLHSTEVASSQAAPELAYDMVTRTDAEMRQILDNTIGIMIPCMNPDGEIIVTDWYDKTVGTPAEGVGPPTLYHHFIGHDNNRDAFMQNTLESRYVAKLLFRDWVPQAYVDHHQMGGYGARIYLPPYAEPVRPDADPIVWREMSWYGAHMAYRMEEENLAGAVTAAIYSGWGHFGFHWITPFHNIAGMLTESASARLATPLFVHPEQLEGDRQLPEYQEQTTFPNPWRGGWWRVRDIIDRQKVAYLAALDIPARNRETVLRNAYLKATRQTERGAEGGTAAYLIPAEQHDRQTRDHLINKLLLQGIDVRRADRDFTHEGRVYHAGSYVVSTAQPKRGVIRYLLGRTFYPDNSYTRNPDGTPIRPYDMSSDNMAEFMGVRVDPVATMAPGELVRVTAAVEPPGRVARGRFGYRIDGRENAGFRAVNLLWNAGVSVRRATPSGDWIVPADAAVAEIARTTGVGFLAVDQDPAASSQPARRLRVGLFQRYLGGNIDEGWTRWLLEDFKFPYTTVRDAELKAGNLTAKYDVIILPSDRLATMTGEAAARPSPFQSSPTDYPEEYRSGFGQEGVAGLDAFVKAGGTLITFGEAGDLAITKLGLPVKNALADLSTKEFWSPGSTLHVKVDRSNRYAWGMPERALAAFLTGSQVYEVVPGPRNHTVRRIVEFIDRDLLQSGWLIGERHLANKATMISVEHGKGTVLMIGFRAQHRAQTHGTFKLVFNALVGSSE
jgi:hypothetical protein